MRGQVNQPIQDDPSDRVEHALIKEAYAATLDPTRLSEFELFWESYIDAQTQKNPDGFDWDNTPVNAHIMMALDILNRVRSINDTIDQARELVESHYGFGFIIDDTGRIIASNTDARQFTSKAKYIEHLSVDSTGCKSIMGWLKDNQSLYNFFQVYIAGAKKAVTWFVSPINIDRERERDSRKYFLITAVDTHLSFQVCQTIGESFGLSDAETQVAGHLTDGLTPKQIANIRGVKITAVRTQIVKIKEKMRAQDIPDIVRMFVLMSLRARAVKVQIERMESLKGLNRPAIKESSMTLGDGRRLQYFEQGHSNGKVILQIHSLAGGVQFPDKFTKLLVKLGLRMISPARAGYGTSEPNPQNDITAVIDSNVEDMMEVLDHIGAKNVTVLTGGGGAMAQKLALKDKRVKALVLSGAVPVWQPEYLDRLPPRYRNIIKTSIHAPWAVPYLVRLSKALIDTGNITSFWKGLHKGNSVNPKGLQTDQSTRDAISKLLSHMFGQGIAAFVADLPTIHMDWTHDTRNLSIPITIAMGTENKGQPPEAVAEYMKSAPQTRLIKIEGADAYQNATHFAEILQIVDALSPSLK